MASTDRVWPPPGDAIAQGGMEDWAHKASIIDVSKEYHLGGRRDQELWG